MYESLHPIENKFQKYRCILSFFILKFSEKRRIG